MAENIDTNTPMPSVSAKPFYKRRTKPKKNNG